MKRQGVTLPERRVELYDQYVKTLLSSWNRVRGLGRPPANHPRLLTSPGTVLTQGFSQLFVRARNPAPAYQRFARSCRFRVAIPDLAPAADAAVSRQHPQQKRNADHQGDFLPDQLTMDGERRDERGQSEDEQDIENVAANDIAQRNVHPPRPGGLHGHGELG